MKTLTTQIQDKIKNDMIYGYRNEDGEKQYPTLKQAANQYQVSYDSLKQKARKWQWKQKRKDYLTKVKRKVEEKRKSEKLSESEAEDIVVEDVKFNNVANKLRRAADKELDRIIDGSVNKSVGYHLMNIGKALESAQKISKTAAGEPSEITSVQGDIHGRYEVTKSLICSDEHIQHEIGVLDAAGKAQGCGD